MPKKIIPEVQEALNDTDVDFTEEEANANAAIRSAPPVAAPPSPPAPVAPQPITLTVDDIQKIVSTAITAAQSGNQQIAEIVTQGIAQARKPIPERTDADYPRISVLNPLGERDHPRPGLKCEFFLGTREPKSQTVQRTYGFVAEDLTAHEQIALNTLEPQSATITLLDDSPVKVEVVATSRDDITNAITRLVLIVPPILLQKGSQNKNMLPSVCGLVKQLTGHDYRKLSKDDLAWFMSEHRKKNYVAVREMVAA